MICNKNRRCHRVQTTRKIPNKILINILLLLLLVFLYHCISLFLCVATASSMVHKATDEAGSDDKKKDDGENKDSKRNATDQKRQHMATSYANPNEEVVKCPNCNYRTDRYKLNRYHLNLNNPLPDRICRRMPKKCRFCDFTAPYQHFIRQHTEAKCPERAVCDFCHIDVSKKQKLEHLSCCYCAVKCVGCEQYMHHENKPDHEAKCAALRFCDYCHFYQPSATHTVETCTSVVRCRGCQAPFRHDEVDTHEEKCEKMATCPFCMQLLPLTVVLQHAGKSIDATQHQSLIKQLKPLFQSQNRLLPELIPLVSEYCLDICPSVEICCGCRQMFSSRFLGTNDKSLRYHQRYVCVNMGCCPHCDRRRESPMLTVDLKKHLADACERTLPCPYCFEPNQQYKMANHHLTCPKYPIRCKWSPSCPVWIRREQMHCHLETECVHNKTSVPKYVINNYKKAQQQLQELRLEMEQLKAAQKKIDGK